jgi:glycosyltransferase involved in cell wall biosynthesis
VRVAWISFLDAHVFSGGGELNQRALIDIGRKRGHVISEHGFLGRRPQRLARRFGLHRRFPIDWSADAFVLANIRNVPTFPKRIPEAIVLGALATGRAAVFQEAWVDVCRFDVPCDGDIVKCNPTCDRSWADRLYTQAHAAIFNSPMQRDIIASVIGVPLPQHQILSRPVVDVTKFRRLDLERDLDVLYVGTISKAKGYFNLLERFGPDRLTLVGRNTLEQPVLGNYLGPVANDQLPAIYNRARFFAHLPEWLEPMGRSVVEAALCGCELLLNDRVGVASYPPCEWRSARHVRRNGEIFWDDFEDAFPPRE